MKMQTHQWNMRPGSEPVRTPGTAQSRPALATSICEEISPLAPPVRLTGEFASTSPGPDHLQRASIPLFSNTVYAGYLRAAQQQ